MTKLIENIYNHSPAFIQNLGVTLYGLKIYNREYGKKFEKLLTEIEKIQWYSFAELKVFQNEKLKKIISHCYENVPYYRETMKSKKLTPGDIKTVDDLSKMPLLTRDDIKKNFSSLIAVNAKKADRLHGHTSGTTGSPLQFLYDRNVCLVKNAFDWRQKRWAGINPGDRYAFFLGRMVVPLNRKKPPFWKYNWLLNHIFFSSFHMSSENLDRYFEKLDKFKPRAIEGYPSTMYLLARYLLSKKRTFPLKVVFTSSETLLPQQREAIEKAFECKLFDFFGLAERVFFATECDAHEGHHINMDFGVTEILKKDDEPAAPGELGRIVATGLYNFTMPLIRYQTTDITSIKPAKCSCKREFPLMDDVTTKDEDIIVTRDGRHVSSSILTHPFKPLQSIYESQIIQEKDGHIVIKIIKLPNYTNRDSEYILEEMKKRVGEDMKIEIKFVDSIARTKAGKFRWVISKLPLEF